MIMETLIYRGVTRGDWVHCNNCGCNMLLPYGTDFCPECKAVGRLSWVDDENTIQDLDDIPEVKRSSVFTHFSGEYMKCSDFYNKVLELKGMEWSELKAALMAHGGKFTWVEHDEELDDDIEFYSPPYVTALLDWGPADMCIHKAWYDMQNGLEFEAYDHEAGEKVYLDFHDIVAGHCAHIIEAIPVTEEVDDVSFDKYATVPQDFVWTPGALCNLQYITALATQLQGDSWSNQCLRDFEFFQRWAIEFTQTEPEDWELADEDYESAIYKFFMKKWCVGR